MEAKRKTKPAETYRPFASDNKTGDWCLAIGVGTEWLVGRYATREEAVAVDLLAMHRKREARRETRELLAKEARARKPGRMLRMMENKRTFGWAFDAEW